MTLLLELELEEMVDDEFANDDSDANELLVNPGSEAEDEVEVNKEVELELALEPLELEEATEDESDVGVEDGDDDAGSEDVVDGITLLVELEIDNPLLL